MHFEEGDTNNDKVVDQEFLRYFDHFFDWDAK